MGYAALLPGLERKFKDFPSQSLSNMLWAAANVGWYSPSAVAAITSALTACLDQSDGQHLASASWALARLRHRDPTFMRQLLSEAVSRREQLQPQAAANLVYAAAVLVCWEGVEGLASLGQGLQLNPIDISNLA